MKAKINKRNISVFRRIKLWIKPLLLLSTILIIGWNTYHYSPSESPKADVNWTIDNTYLVKQVALEAKIEALVNKAYQLDLHEIKEELEQHPWVLEAQVRRLFWDSININIITHKVATRWENVDCQQDLLQKNCQGYITTQGILITPNHLFYHQPGENSIDLVELKSVYDLEKSAQLLDDYQRYQQILKTLKISTFIRSNIDKLSIAPDITVHLGYNQQLQRLQRLVKIVAKLKKKIPLKKLNKATYDMRYPKGFTLKY
ncbi:cell division protein FtsQ/DivIB [Candidatus Thioglobus sp.]|uniref:cell division protein FtsQ/DivIB n=1 Tax=Candidatus Thioglobus sp. TaxID=2026721 RepID=UPI003D0F8796